MDWTQVSAVKAWNPLDRQGISQKYLNIHTSYYSKQKTLEILAAEFRELIYWMEAD